MTVPRLVWLCVVFSLAPRVVQSYLFNLSGSAARCFNLYRVAVQAVCYKPILIITATSEKIDLIANYRSQVCSDNLPLVKIIKGNSLKRHLE